MPRTLDRWWRANRGWFAWKLRHPTGRYHDYYVQRVEESLDAGDVHVSLGARSVQDERHDAAGKLILAHLIREGLRPDHTLVDYGCGSLRIGRHLVGYLQPDRYLGADVTERFYREGLANLDAELRETKRPRFQAIDAVWPREASAPPPDFVISIGVLIHVPRGELGEYLDRVAALTGPTTRAYVSFFDAERHERLSEMTWTWPAERLLAAARARGLAAAVQDLPDWPLAQDRRKRLLVLRRAAS